MDVQDDFGLWERELGAPAGPAEPGESAGRRAVVAATVVLVAGCALVIALGHGALGGAALIVSAVILTLWRIGM